ncbi:hypothetical protein LTR84_008660 [Exophiala bonariae]|uniref:Amine oxidase n=1 Tax=Exophiala bonariae TaxID=1690606 RepID=A0AAV9MWW9_9EURO|nr:hypothetical protein LTR84_008660 [Exophiala bonariae]
MGSIDSNLETPESPDVIIIGGGISGCGAAWYLHKQGRSSMILEASDRVGGKTYSVADAYSEAGYIDLGASWVNDTTQKYINALIEELGLERLEQDVDGLAIAQRPDGSFFTHGYHDSVKASDEDFGLFFAKFHDVVESINTDDVASTPFATTLDSLTVLQWAQKTFPNRPGLPKRVDLYVRALSGADPAQASMLYLAHYVACAGGIKSASGDEKGDAQYQRLIDGTQNISKQMLARLQGQGGKNTILLNHAVDTIFQQDGTVTVTTKNGQRFSVKKVIITIPPVLWTSIQWSPPLPETKALISDRLTMPAYSKIVFTFSHAWWRPRCSGTVFFFDGPIQFVRETSVPAKRCWTLTCFATGKKGFDWGSQSKQARRQSAWDTLASAFVGFVDKKPVPDPVSVHEMLWERQEYIWGAPSASWPPGMLGHGLQKDLKAAHHNVHFAGSETASAFKGYMEGGLQAANRAVQEIVQN